MLKKLFFGFGALLILCGGAFGQASGPSFGPGPLPATAAFPIIIGSTSIAANSTTTSIAGLSITAGGGNTIAASTFNGNTITTGTGTLTFGAGKVVTFSNTLTFTGTDTSSVAFGTGGTVIYNGGALGTPSSGVATNLTGTAAGLTAGTASAVAVGGITGLGTGVATALGNASSATGGFAVQTGPTSWTPTDASGAGLTFTSVSASYTRIGNIVIAYCSFTYPVTADATQAKIGGFPINFPNAAYAGGPAIIYGVSQALYPVINSATANIFTIAGAGTVTNATLSTRTIIFTIVYPAT